MDTFTNKYNIIVFENFAIEGATQFRSKSNVFHSAKFGILYSKEQQILKYTPDSQNIS
mgnify:CR=1 FL=1